MRQLRDARLTIGAPRAIRSARSFGACSPAPARSRSWGSRRGRFRSRSMSQAAGCRASPWWGFPIRRSGNRASGCARPSSTRASSSRCSGSPPTSRPPTCARPAPASTWRSRGRCWRPRGSCRRSGCGGWRSPASWPSTARSGPCPGSWPWRRPRGSWKRRRSRSRRQTRARRPSWASRGSCRWSTSSSSPSWAPRTSRSLPNARHGRRTARRPRLRTSPICGGSRTSATPWRWRLPAATAC